MFLLEPKSPSIAIYRNTNKPVSIYSNTDEILTIPSNLQNQYIYLRNIQITPSYPKNVYSTDKYSLKIEPLVSRFFLDNTENMDEVTILDNADLFNIDKTLSFYIISEEDSTSVPLKLYLDIFDVTDILAIQGLLRHNDITQLHIRTDSGYKPITYEMLASIKSRNKTNIRIEVVTDFERLLIPSTILNLNIEDTVGYLRRIVYTLPGTDVVSFEYRNKQYRKVKQLSDISKPGYFFTDFLNVYITI